MTVTGRETASDAPAGAGVSRRRQILDAAAELFGTKGYHLTGLGEIGYAVGISGPALYRHFSSKEDILATLVEEFSERMFEATERAVREVDDPESALRALVEVCAGMCVDKAHLVAVYASEFRNLDDARQNELARTRRRMSERWIDAMIRARPALSASDARIRVEVAGGLIHHPAYEDVDDRAEHKRLLVDMILGALLAGLPV